KKWKRCTPGWLITWRDLFQKSGRRILGPVGLDLNTLQVNSQHCAWEWSIPRAECTLPVNTYRRGLTGCRVPCNQGCEQQRKCTRLISWVDDGEAGSNSAACPINQIRADSEPQIKHTFAKSATKTNEWRVEAIPFPPPPERGRTGTYLDHEHNLNTCNLLITN